MLASIGKEFANTTDTVCEDDSPMTICQERLVMDCPGDWTLIGDKCYQTINLRYSVTREVGASMCADLGGSLAEVNSEAEHTALSQYYASVNSPVLPIQGAVSSFLTKLSNMRRQHSAWWTAGQFHPDTGHWSWADNR